jgi:hypothetical protein
MMSLSKHGALGAPVLLRGHSASSAPSALSLSSLLVPQSFEDLGHLLGAGDVVLRS